jgi:uncharacterized protein
MRNSSGLWFFAGILFLLDIYIFQVIKYLSESMTPKARLVLYSIYWLVTIASTILILLLPSLYFNPKYKVFISYAFAMVVGLFFFKLITVFFFLLDDLRRGITWIIQKFSNSKSTASTDSSISRSAFMSWMGITIGGSLFSSLLFGFTNKYNYRVKRIKLKFPNLPAAFKGFKIVQLSDIHSGSFDDKEAVAKGVQKVLNEKPELILFTGDLVNNIYTEMNPYKDVFAKLQAPLGVYSVLGNHDYGDYYPWEDRDEAHITKERLAKKDYRAKLDAETNLDTDMKNDLERHYRLYTPLQQAHLDGLKQVQKDMGWHLLMNEHVVLEKGTDKIAIIGIENWGARGNFPKYGRLDLAHKGTETIPFKILMSHDPSHWDAQITKVYPDIDLTLSGHTHGMQFGVEIPFLKWSPIQYIYKQWAGIYEKASQKLYVNRGYGFLGYPGRVGIMPEITVIELG